MGGGAERNLSEEEGFDVTGRETGTGRESRRGGRETVEKEETVGPGWDGGAERGS